MLWTLSMLMAAGQLAPGGELTAPATGAILEPIAESDRRSPRVALGPERGSVARAASQDLPQAPPVPELVGDHGPSFSTETAVRLAVPCLPQQTQVWCWAATVEMVLRYGMTSGVPSQCQIVSGLVNCDCCDLPAYCPYQCLVTAPSMATIAEAVLYFSGQAPSMRGALNFAEVMGELDAGRPIIVGYSGSFGGHVVVLYGYDLDAQTVDICDPFYGDFQNVSFGATFQYAGQLAWTNSLVHLPEEAAGGSTSPDANTDPDPDVDQPTGPCAMVEVVYTDPRHPDLDAMRRFRDEQLRASPLGRRLIDAYYSNSPELSRFLLANRTALALVRAAMIPIMAFVHLALWSPLLALAGLAVLVALCLRWTLVALSCAGRAVTQSLIRVVRGARRELVPQSE